MTDSTKPQGGAYIPRCEPVAIDGDWTAESFYGGKDHPGNFARLSMKHKVSELEGVRYGQLTVRRRAGSSSDGRRMWDCLCACGVARIVTTKALRTGATTACETCSPESARSPLAVRLTKWRLISATGCHEWIGRRNDLGYGRIIVGGVETHAHRALYFMLHPEADRSLVVRHTCDNPPCVNPEHLRLGTVKDNMDDMHARGRFNGGAKPGNKNAIGNTGWQRGGIVKMLGRLPSKLGDEVELP